MDSDGENLISRKIFSIVKPISDVFFDFIYFLNILDCKKRIAEEELKGKDRAEYGAEIIKTLAKFLTNIYGKGFTPRQLYNYESFYKTFPEILHTVCAKSYPLLSWSHYRILLQVKDSTARDWYAKEAHRETWNVRTLQRNVDSQYYYRLLKSQVKEPVKQEMKELTSVYQQDKLEFIKNPVVVEFLDLTSDPSLNETTETNVKNTRKNMRLRKEIRLIYC